MEVVLYSDEALAAVAPIAVYWVYSGVHMAIHHGRLLERYRLNTKEDEDSKNMAGVQARHVLFQHFLQLVSVALLTTFTGGSSSASTSKAPAATSPSSSYLTAACRVAVAAAVFDGYKYAWHRLAHRSRFLYRHLHSWHHRIVVPYAYGTIYGHPLEALMADTVGASLALFVSGMSPRATAVFLSLCIIIKAIDNHCGVCMMPRFLQLLWNDAAYHGVHHMPGGVRHNFSDLFFVTWDKMFGTHMPYAVEERSGGGLKLRILRPKPAPKTRLEPM